MKYCKYCGREISDDANFCEFCGKKLVQGSETAQSYYSQSNSNTGKPRDESTIKIIKVFMILGCISVGWTIIPLAWCIPMTVSIFNKLKSGEDISIGLKVCTLLLVNLVAGILMLVALPEGGVEPSGKPKELKGEVANDTPKVVESGLPDL